MMSERWVTGSWRPDSASSRSRLPLRRGRCCSLTSATHRVDLDLQPGQARTTLHALGGGKITLREAQAIAYLLEHGRWPDPETATWFEQRTSQVALDFLLSARLRERIAATAPREDE